MPNGKGKRKRVVVVDTLDKLFQLMTNNNIETNPNDTLTAQITTLTDRKEQLEGGYQYIETHISELRNVFTGLTPTEALNHIYDAIQSLDARLHEIDEVYAQRQNFANREIAKREKGGYTGDGNCYVTFVNIGMGDCTLIATPQGSLIMIDCGSDSLSDVVPSTNCKAEDDSPSAQTFIGDAVKHETFLNGATKVQLLFLTHPDSDHHDKLKTILEPLNIKIGMVYYGGADAITAYTSSGFIKSISGESAGVLRNVVIREEPILDVNKKVIVTRTINGSTLPSSGKPGEIGAEFIDAATGKMVIYYEDSKGDEKTKASNFVISVIAGNATGAWKDGKFVGADVEIKSADEEKGEGTLPNKRSLILMIECFGKTVLVCGDATAVTERVAINNYSAVLGNVQYLRMGHHGSPTSSSLPFLNAQPKMQVAVASTGGQCTVKNKLPKQAIIALYPPRVAGDAYKHSIFAFKSEETQSYAYFTDLTQQIWATGSNGNYKLTIAP